MTCKSVSCGFPSQVSCGVNQSYGVNQSGFTPRRAHVLSESGGFSTSAATLTGNHSAVAFSLMQSHTHNPQVQGWELSAPGPISRQSTHTLMQKAELLP